MGAPADSGQFATPGIQPVQEVAQSYLGGLWIALDQRRGEPGRLLLLRHVHLPEQTPPDALQRMACAARDAMALNYENVLSVFDVFQQAESLAIAYEYAEAVPLRTLQSWASHRSVPVGVSLRILIDLLRGVKALHGALMGWPSVPPFGGLSPDSVLVARDGRTRLCDPLVSSCATLLEGFGSNTAKLAYTAPEQLHATAPLAPTTDVFTCAAMLWELLSGRRLLSGTRATIERKLLEHDLPRLGASLRGDQSIRPELLQVVERSLSSDVSKRPATPGALASELERCGHEIASQPEVARFLGELGGQQFEHRQGAVRARLAALQPGSGARLESLIPAPTSAAPAVPLPGAAARAAAVAASAAPAAAAAPALPAAPAARRIVPLPDRAPASRVSAGRAVTPPERAAPAAAVPRPGGANPASPAVSPAAAPRPRVLADARPDVARAASTLGSRASPGGSKAPVAAQREQAALAPPPRSPPKHADTPEGADDDSDVDEAWEAVAPPASSAPEAASSEGPAAANCAPPVPFSAPPAYADGTLSLSYVEPPPPERPAPRRAELPPTEPPGAEAPPPTVADAVAASRRTVVGMALPPLPPLPLALPRPVPIPSAPVATSPGAGRTPLLIAARNASHASLVTGHGPVAVFVPPSESPRPLSMPPAAPTGVSAVLAAALSSASSPPIAMPGNVASADTLRPPAAEPLPASDPAHRAALEASFQVAVSDPAPRPSGWSQAPDPSSGPRGRAQRWATWTLLALGVALGAALLLRAASSDPADVARPASSERVSSVPAAREIQDPAQAAAGAKPAASAVPEARGAPPSDASASTLAARELRDEQLLRLFALEPRAKLPSCAERLGASARRHGDNSPAKSRAQLLAARRELVRGKNDEAYRLLCSATAHSSANTAAWQALGELSLHMGDADQARQATERALKNKPTDRGLLGTLGDAWVLLGDLSRSRALWARSVPEAGTDAERTRRLATLFGGIGQRQLRASGYGAALVFYRRAAVLSAGGQAPSVGMGEALRGLNRREAAAAWEGRVASAFAGGPASPSSLR